ncbi:hypothetical protein CL622_07160 [archaeon]|nr:hypothetical protein [archaeon]|tara:strand:- start:55 stop:705 length:651 start_codon:yes stop_codon:yes gene_type:complete
MPNIPGLDAMNWVGMFDSVLYWMGYGFMMLAIIAIFGVVFIFMQYKYKVTIMQRGGTGQKDEVHSVGRIVRDRAKEYKDKNGVTKWKLLIKRKEIMPIQYDQVLPGRNVFLYHTGASSFFPVKFNCGNPSASFEPIPHDINLWTGLELREAAQEYQKKTFWDQYGNVAVMMGTIMFCLILVGVTVYYTYQHANGVTNSLGSLTESLRGITTLRGPS